jgi:hypothetical protein
LVEDAKVPVALSSRKTLTDHFPFETTFPVALVWESSNFLESFAELYEIFLELLSARVIMAKAGMRTLILELADVLLDASGPCARHTLLAVSKKINRNVLLKFTPLSTGDNY